MTRLRLSPSNLLAAILALGLAGSAIPARAQVISLYNFNATTPSPSSVAAGITATTAANASMGTFLSNQTLSSLTGLLQIEAAPNANNDSAAVSNNSYFQVTLTPKAGFRLSFSQMQFSLTKNSGANRNFFVRSSADNFASTLTPITWSGGDSGADGVLSGQDIPNDSTTLRNYSLSLSGSAFQNLSTATTFRFYLSSPSTGNFVFMDNLQFRGAAGSIIPEPSSIALVSLGMAALTGTLLRRRR